MKLNFCTKIRKMCNKLKSRLNLLVNQQNNSLTNNNLWNNFCCDLFYLKDKNHRKMKSHFIILLFVLSLFSCKEEIPNLKQKIYFEKHYANMAWLPKSSGWLIDSVGNVREFRWVEVFHDWYDPDSLGYVSNSDMDKNISYCQTINYHINPDTLQFYINKIYEASKGKISEPQLVMADAGTTTYSAFIFEEKTNRYKQVFIRMDGDLLKTNSSPEANEIFQWMARFGK